MDTQATIEALLAQAYPGERKDGLKMLARVLAMQCGNEEEAKAIVGKTTADGVKSFIAAWRSDADAEISKANKTYEEGLRKQFEFKSKTEPDKQTTEPKEDKPGASDPKEIERIIDEAIAKATQGLKSQVQTLEQSKINETRRAALEDALGKETPKAIRDSVMMGFEKGKFSNDDEFNLYVEGAKKNIADYNQEMADKGLGGHSRPILGSINKDGVSQGVADYIASKTDEAKKLGGKEI